MTPKAGKNNMSDEQRLSQVEAEVSELRTYMTTLTDNVNKGFNDINKKISEGNEATLKEIGNLYGKMNHHALEDARHRNVSWPLVVSVIAVVFVAASFFYTTINDRFDRTIQYEKELRQSENEKTILRSELNFTKKLLNNKTQ